MANVCTSRLFVSAPAPVCVTVLSSAGLAERESDARLSFDVLVPEPADRHWAAGTMSAARVQWRLRHWGTTVDPLSATLGGDSRERGVDFAFETPEPPMVWAAALAAAHPKARLLLLFDCSEAQRAGDALWERGTLLRHTKITSDGYQLWQDSAAAARVYTQQRPPYDGLRID